jgi:TonB family protein
MQQGSLFLQDSSAHLCLPRRLFDQLIEAAREFRGDPRLYIASAISGIGRDRRRTSFLRLGFAVGLLIYSLTFLAMLVFWSIGGGAPAAFRAKELRVIHVPDGMTDDFRMAQSDKENHGGGGGGNNSSAPASSGLRPPFNAAPPAIARTTHTPPKPPVLAIDMTLLGDPTHNLRRDELTPVGLPDGVDGPPSDGPGSGRGIGSGKDGGVGPGTGPGFGPGKKGGWGGEDFGPGGEPRAARGTETVDSKPTPLNYPRPLYTEEARKNKVQGVVRARVLVGSDGAVKQVKIVRGLPDGLNEQAIAAALKMRFRPATKDGKTVAHWTVLDVEFNLR